MVVLGGLAPGESGRRPREALHPPEEEDFEIKPAYWAYKDYIEKNR
jgi:hypothetical protein